MPLEPDAISFQANRQKLETFFSDRQKNQKLRNAIAEFYQVQHKFHMDMSSLVMAFSKINYKLTPGQRFLLITLIDPYRSLIKNPFPAAPTGNIQRDVEKIIQVIFTHHQEFQAIFMALFLCTSNLKVFNQLLEIFKNDSELVAILTNQLGYKSWLYVPGHIDYPFQNLFKYELTLKAIYKELIMTNAVEQNVLDNLKKTIEIIIARNNNVNENKEIIMMLCHVERILGNLLSEELKKNTNTAEATSKLRSIEFVMFSVRKGIERIGNDEQDINIFLSGLLQLLKDIDESYGELPQTKSYIETVTAYSSRLIPSIISNFYQGLFKSVEVITPIMELKKIIIEIDDTLKKADTLKELQHKFLVGKNAS